MLWNIEWFITKIAFLYLKFAAMCLLLLNVDILPPYDTELGVCTCIYMCIHIVFTEHKSCNGYGKFSFKTQLGLRFQIMYYYYNIAFAVLIASATLVLTAERNYLVYVLGPQLIVPLPNFLF